LLPLIGPDPKIQKKILEDDDNSFRIKLGKVRRFRNRSENINFDGILKSKIHID